MGDIVNFTGHTLVDLPVDRILEAAKDCERVLVIGRDRLGNFNYYSSFADKYEMIWYLEKLKFELLSGNY